MIALPLRSSSTPSPLTLPSAWSTPGAVRTRSSVEDGIVGGAAKSSSTATFAVTVTSVPFWARSNRSLNEASIVSVNTNVPATNATPSTTAKPVRTVRSLRAQRPFSAIFSISGSSRDVPAGRPAAGSARQGRRTGAMLVALPGPRTPHGGDRRSPISGGTLREGPLGARRHAFEHGAHAGPGVGREVRVDPARVDRPHAPQQVDALAGDRDLQRAAIAGVRLAPHIAGGLDAVDEAAHRGGGEGDLARKLVDAQAPLGLAVERPQQVVPAEVGEARRRQVAPDRARHPGVGGEERPPGGERLVVDLGHRFRLAFKRCTCNRCICMYSWRMTSYENKVVLITGGGGGIGRAAAARFLEQGASVVLSGTRSSVLDAAQAALDPSRERVATYPGQITTREQAHELVAFAVERFGGVDVLVNSTGIFRPAPFLEQTEDHLEEALGSILRPTYWVSQAAALAMRERGGGAIVNVGSMWAIDAIATTPTSAYSAAQAGRHALTKNLALELAPDNIRINTVALAFVETPAYERFMDAETAREVLDSVNAFHPLGRHGVPADVAEAVLFLAGADAGWITGTTLPIDGGVLAGRSPAVHAEAATAA